MQSEPTSEDEVRRAFQHVNPNKATGPDNFAPRVPKACAEQLAHSFWIIFNACFSTNTVPTTWKTACTVPIPKRPVIPSMNDLRHIALTSAVMKVYERVEKLVKEYIDPLQFAYRKNRSTDDTVLYSLENIYSHLENKTKTTTRSTVRLMFFDLSSHIYLFKTFKHETTVIRYFMDLTSRLQYVRLNGLLTSAIGTNTGAPQGTVLAPFCLRCIQLTVEAPMSHVL